MDNWLIHKYIGLISAKLLKFRRKSSNLYNFKCPLCGDSSKNPNKTRAFFYEKKGAMIFHCHNCGQHMKAELFIKEIDHPLYNEYMIEKLNTPKRLPTKKVEEFKMEAPKFNRSPLSKLTTVKQLLDGDNLKTYAHDRQIPEQYLSKLYSCPNFMEFTNKLIPNKFAEKALKYDGTRLLIPYFNQNKQIHAYNGRSLDPKEQIRYIKIVLDESIPNIYGLDTVDMNKDIFILEGEFDSMFVDNAIATGGGDLVTAISFLPKEKCIVVLDNEPRSKDTRKKINKAVNHGYRVVIWPDSFEHKDINNAIIAGLNKEYIKYIIDNNIYSEMDAKMRLTEWSKAA